MPGYGHFAGLSLIILSPRALPLCCVGSLRASQESPSLSGAPPRLLSDLVHIAASRRFSSLSAHCFPFLSCAVTEAPPPWLLGPALPCGGAGRAWPWPHLTGEPCGPLTANTVTSFIAVTGLYRNHYFY